MLSRTAVRGLWSHRRGPSVVATPDFRPHREAARLPSRKGAPPNRGHVPVLTVRPRGDQSPSEQPHPVAHGQHGFREFRRYGEVPFTKVTRWADRPVFTNRGCKGPKKGSNLKNSRGCRSTLPPRHRGPAPGVRLASMRPRPILRRSVRLQAAGAVNCHPSMYDVNSDDVVSVLDYFEDLGIWKICGAPSIESIC